MAPRRKTVVAAALLALLPLAGCLGDPLETFPAGPEGEVEATEPLANFDYTCSLLTCHFDATNSSDPDGEVASYAWRFGDGEEGSGAVVNHTYEESGDYNVTLTVTDDANLSSSTTQLVKVTLDRGETREREENSTGENRTAGAEGGHEDQRWTWNGSVGPEHRGSFTFPVNATPVDHVLVRYELEDDLGAGQVELTLSNPNGTTVRRGNVSQASSPIVWNLTGAEANAEGTWTVEATGFGVPADDTGTRYDLMVEVDYPPTG